MAISHVGSNTQDSGGALSLTFTVPAATTTDDLILVFVKQSENTTQQTWDDDGGGGNGYTRAVYNRTTGGRDMETAIYWKVATSGSEANPTFTWATTPTTTEPMSGIMEVYRGVDPDVPINEITHLNAQNDANPPNPDIDVGFDDSWVVCFHGATHDDITTVAAPTGFTLRSQVWNGTADDHRNVFSADITNRDLSGNTYSPPDWGHSVANTTPEYHTYSVALNETQNSLIFTPTDGTEYQWSATNITITGKGFEATQGTGKVELWSDLTGTTKVSQSIDTWGDTSIQFDVTQGALTDGSRYLVVTNDSGDVTNKVRLLMGDLYAPWGASKTDADHYWQMDNAYTDEAARGGTRPFNAAQTGTPDFVATPICRTNAYSFRLNNTNDRSEVADSAYTNITNTHSDRNIGGWIRLENLVESPVIIYEEGGGVNNIYLLLLPNGRLAANVADSNGAPDFKAQAYADFPLITGRPYHVMIEADMGNEFRLWIDGEIQDSVAGSMGTDTTMSTHSGDWCFGQPDGNLDTGGVDIAYLAATTVYLAHWGTWSNSGGGAPLTTAEIRDSLFRDGALPEHTIAAGTEAAMQTTMETYDTQTHADQPLTFEIPAKTGGGDFELTLTDQVFPDEIKFQINYKGTDTLTIVNSGTSNVVASKCYSPTGGTITIENDVAVKVTVKDIDTGSVIQNANVIVEAAAGGDLAVGTDIVKELTNASGVAEDVLRFTNNQPVTGRVRKASGSPYYQTAPISATITSDGLDIEIFLIKDE